MKRTRLHRPPQQTSSFFLPACSDRYRLPLASCVLSLLFLFFSPQPANSLAAPVSFQASRVSSQVFQATCRLELSVGRIPGTAMPEEWASSGTRLVLPELDVQFREELCRDSGANQERFLGTRPPFRVVAPLGLPKFVGMGGEEEVDVTSGAYCFEVRTADNGKHTLRFCLDFPNGAKRNDVELPAERIYFTTSCWKLEDRRLLDTAREEMEETQDELSEVKEELYKLREKSQGFFQQVLSLRSNVLLVEKRKRLEAKLLDIHQLFPLTDDVYIDGPQNTIFFKQGFMSVKRKGGIMGRREEYHWVGTFTIKEFLDAAGIE